MTVETTGTMLMGSEIGAALTALEPLGIDGIGLNCATGPAEMSEHLRHLARHARVAARPACRTPACRCSTRDGAHYPLTPDRARRRARRVHHASSASPWSAAAAARRPSTCAPSSSASRGRGVRRRAPAARGRASRASTSTCRSGRTRPTCRSASAPTPTARKAFREAMLAARWDDCVDIARDQTRDGAHLLDVCVDYVGRDGVADMREVVSRFATASDPAARARLDRARRCSRPGSSCSAAARWSTRVNFEDGDGPGSRVRADHADRPRARRRRRRADHRRAGPGPHRRAQGRASPSG